MNINKNGVWKQNCLHERILPEGYMQLEYIESTGTQYIDTGFVPNAQTSVELEFSDFIVKNDYGAPLGARNGDGSNQFWFFIQTNNFRIYSRWLGSHYDTGYNYTANAKIKIKYSKYGLFINNTFYPPVFSGTDFSNLTSTIWLFALNNGGFIQYGSTMKIHSFKLWDNNILIRNMIPAQRNSDSVLGMYDTVNNVFYTNSGTGVFKSLAVSTDYVRLEYVQSDGTQYINTGIKGNAKHYYKLAWLKEGVTRQLMGYGGSSKEYWGLQNKNTGKIELGGAVSFLPSIDITQPQEYEWDYHYANSINRIYLNNSLILESIPSPDVTNTTIKFLNIYANLNTYPCNVKIYSYIIKDWNNNILAQYIPVKRNNDDKIGLFEIVSQTFVQSGNENNFIAGPNYIQTDNVKIYKNNKSIEANDFIEL